MVTVSRAAWKMTTTTTTTTSGVRACLFPGRGLLFRATPSRVGASSSPFPGTTRVSLRGDDDDDDGGSSSSASRRYAAPRRRLGNKSLRRRRSYKTACPVRRPVWRRISYSALVKRYYYNPVGVQKTVSNLRPRGIDNRVSTSTFINGRTPIAFLHFFFFFKPPRHKTQ